MKDLPHQWPFDVGILTSLWPPGKNAMSESLASCLRWWRWTMPSQSPSLALPTRTTAAARSCVKTKITTLIIDQTTSNNGPHWNRIRRIGACSYGASQDTRSVSNQRKEEPISFGRNSSFAWVVSSHQYSYFDLFSPSSISFHWLIFRNRYSDHNVQSYQGARRSPKEIEGPHPRIGQEDISKGSSAQDGGRNQKVEVISFRTLARRGVGPTWRVLCHGH